MPRDIEYYYEIIEGKLKEIDEKLRDVEKDVESDLDDLIEKKLLQAAKDSMIQKDIQDEIKQKMLSFKNANKDLLVNQRRRSLEDARKRFLILQEQLNSLSRLFFGVGKGSSEKSKVHV